MSQISVDLPNFPLRDEDLLQWAKNFQVTLYNKLIELNYLLSSPVSSHNHVKAHITDTPWAWTDVSKVASNLTDIVARLHSSLQSIGANDHHAQIHASAHHAGGGDLLAHQSIPGVGTLTHATIDSYLDQAVKISSSPSFADIKVLSPWVDVRSYASFSAAVDAIGSSEKTLLIPNEQAVSADKTVPSNITLRFLQGGSLNIATTKTVTINGRVEAGLYQIFKCTGTGKVVFGMGAVEKVCPQHWGALPSATASVNTAAIQAAIDSLNPIAETFDPVGAIDYSFLPALYFSSGFYNLNNQLIIPKCFRIFTDGQTTLAQTDSTKNILYSDVVHRISLEGINFDGGKTQIYLTNDTNLSSTVEIRKCILDSSHDYALVLNDNSNGGYIETSFIESRIFRCYKAIKAYGDSQINWVNSTIGFLGALTPNDSALFYLNNVRFTVQGAIFDPGSLSYQDEHPLVRWIDNHGSFIHISGSRFDGGYTSGIPVIYEFSDMLSGQGVYPYFGGGMVTMEKCLVASGPVARADRGVIILKTGLPSVISFENLTNIHGVPLINTQNFTAGTLATYLAGISPATAPGLSIRLIGNIGWGLHSTEGLVSLAVDNSSDFDRLRHWIDADRLQLGATAGNIKYIPNLGIEAIRNSHKTRAFLTTTQSNIVASTWVKILLDGESYDPGSNFNVATNRFVAPVSGYYSIVAQIYWTGVIATKDYLVGIRKNGAAINYNIGHSSTTADLGTNIMDIVYLSVNDYIDLWVAHNAGANTPDVYGYVTGAPTYLCVQLLSMD